MRRRVVGERHHGGVVTVLFGQGVDSCRYAGGKRSESLSQESGRGRERIPGGVLAQSGREPDGEVVLGGALRRKAGTGRTPGNRRVSRRIVASMILRSAAHSPSGPSRNRAAVVVAAVSRSASTNRRG